MKKSIRKRAPSPPGTDSGKPQTSKDEGDSKSKAPAAEKKKYSSGESSEEEEEDTRELEGNVYTKSGVEVRYITWIFFYKQIIDLCNLACANTEML